jgi:hypothetical protein
MKIEDSEHNVTIFAKGDEVPSEQKGKELIENQLGICIELLQHLETEKCGSEYTIVYKKLAEKCFEVEQTEDSVYLHVILNKEISDLVGTEIIDRTWD